MRSMSKESSSNNVLVLILGGLLVVAMFFIGRLSSRVEMMKGGDQLKGVETEAGVVEEEESVLSMAKFRELAESFELNMDEFNSCLDEGKTADAVDEDASLADELGIGGTPTFVINGWVLSGARDADFFREVIEAELGGGADEVLVEQFGEEGVEKVELALKGENLRGEAEAPVKIVEFSDFECPYCTTVYPTMKTVLDEYGDEVVFEYRHLPLSFHENAQKAAEAVECAGEQGKFWEMHDALFEVQI